MEGESTMPSRLRQSSVALLIIIGVLLFANASVAEENSIRIGGSHVLSILPLIAIEQGFLEEQDLNVEFQRIRVGKLTMDAVLSGSIDFGSVVDTNLAMNSFRDTELSAIAITLSDFDNGFAYLNNTNKKSSSELYFSDLKGKRIGYLPATTSHFLLLSYLEAASWTMADIRAVPLQPATMLPALRSGAVDAVSIWNPWRFTILKNLGEKVGEIQNTAGIYRPTAYLATRQSLLKERPEVVKKLFKALLEARNYAQTHPKEIRARYAEWNGMDNEALDSVWPRIKIRIDGKPDGALAVEKDVRLIKKFDSHFRDRKARSVDNFFDFTVLTQLLSEEAAAQ